MMSEAESWAAEAAEDIQIGSLCRERQHRCGQSCLAVEAGAAHAGASQEMGDWFQSVFSKQSKDSIWLGWQMPTAVKPRVVVQFGSRAGAG